MPRRVDFSEETALRLLRGWAQRVTEEFVSKRGATEEACEKKGFTAAELVGLAVTACVADDLFREESQQVPDSNKRQAGPCFSQLASALLREFGFVIGFLAHVRQRWHVSRGARRKPVVAMVRDGRGWFYGSEETVRHFMRNPFFVRRCRERLAQLRDKAGSDHEIIREELASLRFSVGPSAVREALRGKSVSVSPSAKKTFKTA